MNMHKYSQKLKEVSLNKNRKIRQNLKNWENLKYKKAEYGSCDILSGFKLQRNCTHTHIHLAYVYLQHEIL